MHFKPAQSQSDFARCAWLRGLVFGAGQNYPVSADISN